MVSLYSFIKSKLILVLLVSTNRSQDFKGFDDTILYKINWPGKDVTERLANPQDKNTLKVKTAIGETYQCFLPNQDEVNKESELSYDGPSPLDLLSPLISKQACSHRIDGGYWIYEVCHGRHVRQYHNEREGKEPKEDQEYYLGKWKIFDNLKLENDLKRLKNLNYPGPTKTRKVDGVNLPYFEMNMSDGTICDLNGRPRQTSVLYVCYTQSKHSVFSVKETSTCQYEVVILTSLLCSHPWYKPPNSDELNIDCLAVDDSPRKPHNLKVLQSDSYKLKRQIKMLTDPLKKESYVLAVSIDKNGDAKIQVKVHPASDPELNLLKEDSLLMHTKTQSNEIQDFITGKLCLYGGSGWWKYEICYNKHIRQIHKEKGKPDEDEIVELGSFILEEHIKWLTHNEEKKPKFDAHGQRQIVSHFYSSGSVCLKTGEKRETEVRYKCVKGRHNENSLSLYLLEPKTCKYVLTIKSPVLCKLINGPMDENGIFIIKTDSDLKNEENSSSTQVGKDEHLQEHNPKSNRVAKQKTGSKKKTVKIEL